MFFVCSQKTPVKASQEVMFDQGTPLLERNPVPLTAYLSALLTSNTVSCKPVLPNML